MAQVGFERTISAIERPLNYALDRAVTGTGTEDVTAATSLNVHSTGKYS